MNRLHTFASLLLLIHVAVPVSLAAPAKSNNEGHFGGRSREVDLGEPYASLFKQVATNFYNGLDATANNTASLASQMCPDLTAQLKYLGRDPHAFVNLEERLCQRTQRRSCISASSLRVRDAMRKLVATACGI